MFSKYLVCFIVTSVALAQTGVQYTWDQTGLTSFSWNGIDLLNHSYSYVSLFNVTLGGVQYNPSWTKTTTASGLKWTTATPNVSFELTFSGQGTDTFTIGFCATNNDSRGKLTSIGFDQMVGLNFPSDATVQNNGGVHYANGHVWDTYYSWSNGVAVIYKDSNFKKMVSYVQLYGLSPKITLLLTQNYPWLKPNSYFTGVDYGNTECDNLKIRFGPAGTSVQNLIPEAYNAWNQSFPQTLIWPDRRPFVMFMMSDCTKTSTNPRGYCTGNYQNPDFIGSGYNDTRAAFLNWIDSVVALQVSKYTTYKPQAIIFWDIEGQEFPQVFTYVGHPGDTDYGSRLSYLSPEMERTDANGEPMVDAIMRITRKYGIEPGLCLRPGRHIVAQTGAPTYGCYWTIDVSQSYLTLDRQPWSGYGCDRLDITFDDVNDRVVVTTRNWNHQLPFWGYWNGQAVKLWPDDPSKTLPGGLVMGQDYYACNWDLNNGWFQLSTKPDCSTIITDLSGGTGSYYVTELWRGPTGISSQSLPSDYNDFVTWMAKKIAYARARWGIKYFYVDSTAHCYSTWPNSNRCTWGGAAYHDAWEDLRQMFPDVYLMPENTSGGFSHAHFAHSNNNEWGINTGTYTLYPDYWVTDYVGGQLIGYANNRDWIRWNLRHGVPYMLYRSESDTLWQMLNDDYASTALDRGSIQVIDNGRKLSFNGNPGAFKYPLVMRVVFRADQNFDGNETTYCTRKEDTFCYQNGSKVSTLNLSGLGYYRIEYRDFHGKLISAGNAKSR